MFIVSGITSVRLYHENVPKQAHMDEIPVPMGSWQEDFDNKQKKYNRHLATGVLFAAATLGYVSDNLFRKIILQLNFDIFLVFCRS